LAAGVPWPENCIATNSIHTQERLVISTGRILVLTRVQLLGRIVPFRVIPLSGAPTRSIGIRYLRDIVLPPLATKLIDHLSQVADNFSREVAGNNGAGSKRLARR
jgi:hypothetical protein